jgi:hypothetical protein
MRLCLRLLGLLVVASGSAAAPTPDDPVLPLRIPGYELRSLDVRKPVVFEVAGSEVRVSLPIYVYYPAACTDRRDAVKLLREAYGEAVELGRRQEWSAADLRRILAALDESLTLLERNP